MHVVLEYVRLGRGILEVKIHCLIFFYAQCLIIKQVKFTWHINIFCRVIIYIDPEQAVVFILIFYVVDWFLFFLNNDGKTTSGDLIF